MWPYACGEVPSEQLTGDNRAHAEARISKRDTYAAGGVAPPPSPAGAERIGSEAAGWQGRPNVNLRVATVIRATALSRAARSRHNVGRLTCCRAILEPCRLLYVLDVIAPSPQASPKYPLKSLVLGAGVMPGCDSSSKSFATGNQKSGVLVCHFVARSNACAICRTFSSSNSRPVIIRPTGRPACVKPQGTEMEG